MYELFMATFVTLFIVIDPPGIAPIFAVMTDGASAAHKRRMVFKATFTASIILFLFAFLGNGFLGVLGISMTAFKTAGGILLFMIALEMVFEKRTEKRKKKAEGMTHDSNDHEPDENYEDISVFPLAIPFISGPGSITTILLLMSQSDGVADRQAIIMLALVAVLISTVIIMLAASKIIEFMGQTVANAITRILGVILAALATQYVFDGIRVAFFGS